MSLGPVGMVEQDKLRELLRAFDVAVLVTARTGGGIHARPMAIAEVEDDCTTWFVTARGSPKALEIQQDGRAYVICQRGATAFLSLAGKAALVDDPPRLDRVWKTAYEPWFPKGKEDPEVALLRVHPDEGEYWDGRGLTGVRYVIEAARAMAHGARVKVEEPALHGRTKL